MKIKAVLFSLLGLSAADFAHATQRTVYFDQTAIATTTNGLTSNATAKCRLVVNNPSSYDQTIVVTIYPNATGSAAGRASGTGPTSSWAASGSSASGYFTSGTLTIAAGTTPSTYDFLYPTYTTGTTGDQQLTCRGSITANDSSSSTPGFLVATGMILTFAESSLSQTQGATANTTAFMGNAIYSQISISINRGKPF